MQTMLGLVIDTTSMTVSLTLQYISEIRDLLNNTWHICQKCFSISEAQTLVGIAWLAEGAYWVFHLLPHLYTSIAAALACNKEFLGTSSAKFKCLVDDIKHNTHTTPNKEQQQVLSFAMKQAAKLIHH